MRKHKENGKVGKATFITSLSENIPLTSEDEYCNGNGNFPLDRQGMGDSLSEAGDEVKVPSWLLLHLRNQISFSLERTRQLEEEAKLARLLQVQLAVMKEEKRLLLHQLKARACHIDDQHVSDQSPPLVTPRFKRKFSSELDYFSSGSNCITTSDESHNEVFKQSLAFSVLPPPRSLIKEGVIDLKSYLEIKNITQIQNEKNKSSPYKKHALIQCLPDTKTVGVGTEDEETSNTFNEVPLICQNGHETTSLSAHSSVFWVSKDPSNLEAITNSDNQSNEKIFKFSSTQTEDLHDNYPSNVQSTFADKSVDTGSLGEICPTCAQSIPFDSLYEKNFDSFSLILNNFSTEDERQRSSSAPLLADTSFSKISSSSQASSTTSLLFLEVDGTCVEADIPGEELLPIGCSQDLDHLAEPTDKLKNGAPEEENVYTVNSFKRYVPSPEFLVACRNMNSSLVCESTEVPSPINEYKDVLCQEWFHISSRADSSASEVEDMLDLLEDMSPELMSFMVNLLDDNGNSALHYAVSYGNYDVINIILDTNVMDVNVQNKAGYSCTMLAAVVEPPSGDGLEGLERLLAHCDVDARAQAPDNQTALMLAASHGHASTVRLLLNAGAQPNLADCDGSTALMCAAEHGRLECARMLLSHPDCDPLLPDNDGCTALNIAMHAGHKDMGLLIYAAISVASRKKSFSSMCSLVPHPPSRVASPPSSLQQRQISRHRSLTS